MSEIWETFNWSIIICPLLSSKSVRLIWTIQGRLWSLPACGEDIPVLQFDEAETWQITRERITSRRLWWSYLLGSWINPNWTKPFEFWFSWMQRHHIWQHIRVRVPLHQKSCLNFMNEWTRFRWVRRRFVQIWLSIIHMTCKFFSNA